jgi:hypothetical protein
MLTNESYSVKKYTLLFAYKEQHIVWYEIALLVLFLCLKILLMGAMLREGFIALSVDDFMRQFLSYSWARDGAFFDSIWPPLQFWIVGTIIKVFPEIGAANLLVNSVFSSLTVIIIYFLFRLFFGRKIAIFSTLLAVTLPWQSKLSLSGLCEPIYHFFLFLSLYCVYKWELSGKRYCALFCGLSLLFANMLRIEAWIFYMAVNIYVIVRLVQYPKKYGKDTLIFTLLIPSTFIVLWLFLGKVFTNYEILREDHIRATAELTSKFISFFRYPAYLFLVSPLIAFVGIVGLIHSILKDKGIAVRYCMIPALYFLGLIGISLITGSDSLAAPLRFVLPFIFLMIPISLQLFFNSGKTWFVKTGYVFLGILLIWNIYFLFNFDRNDFADIAKASKILKSAWASGSFDKASTVLFEKNLQHPIYYGDQLAIKVLSNHPDNILVYNPLTEKISVDELIQGLEQKNITAVVACSDGFKKKLSTTYNNRMAVGIYTIFWLRTHDFPTKPADLLHDEPLQTERIIPINSIAELQGYDKEHGYFPRAIVTHWYIKENIYKPIMIQYKLTHRKTGSTFVLNPHVLGNYRNTIAYNKEDLLFDRQDLILPSKALPGSYNIAIKLTLDLINSDSSNKESHDIWHYLTNVTLITNKRDVLTRLLTGKLDDFEIGLRVISSFF